MLDEEIKLACKLNDLIMHGVRGCSLVIEHVLTMA